MMDGRHLLHTGGPRLPPLTEVREEIRPRYGRPGSPGRSLSLYTSIQAPPRLAMPKPLPGYRSGLGDEGCYGSCHCCCYDMGIPPLEPWFPLSPPLSAPSSPPTSIYIPNISIPSILDLRDLEVFNTLGTGTFGRVFLCLQRDRSNPFMALKVMPKLEVLRLKQLEHVFSEKAILSTCDFPFIVKLFGTFQNQRNIYMLLEYAAGGEMFSYLRRIRRFSVESARFYAAEILLAIEYLHDRSIVFRDLKPENLLLDATGHIKITDFGFAKVVKTTTWTLCGTPEYLAPEIIEGKGHGKEVDWWALGVLIYEMLTGCPPFYHSSPFMIYEKILEGNLLFPDHVDPLSRDLITRLLTKDRAARLGSSLRNDARDIKSHPWFHGVQWSALIARDITPPIQPRIAYPGDTSNFEAYPEASPEIILPDWEADPFQALFRGF